MFEIRQDRALSRAPKGETFLASSSFWWLLAFLGLWLHLSAPCSYHLILHVLVSQNCLYLSYSDMYDGLLDSPQNLEVPILKVLNLITSFVI